MKTIIAIDDTLSATRMSDLKKSGTDWIEIRVDKFSHFEDSHIVKFFSSLKKLNIPLLSTVRSPKEGGASNLSDSQRLHLFTIVAPFSQMLDVELSSKSLLDPVLSLAKKYKTKTLLSAHNFKNTPSNEQLNSLLKKALTLRPDYIKFAVTPTSQKDLRRFTLWTLNNSKHPLITIAMNEIGKISRIAFLALGSRYTYTYLGKATAPGQLNLEETKQLMDIFYKGAH